jgi:hypothetical protein
MDATPTLSKFPLLPSQNFHSSYEPTTASSLDGKSRQYVDGSSVEPRPGRKVGTYPTRRRTTPEQKKQAQLLLQSVAEVYHWAAEAYSIDIDDLIKKHAELIRLLGGRRTQNRRPRKTYIGYARITVKIGI